jgi:DNA-binding Lrp family transcriptional regulator
MPRHLDATDIILVQMMLSNSRTPAAEIADFLKIAPEEVERRIDSLAELGVLRSFVTRYDPFYLRAVGVLTYGRAEATTLEDAISKLRKNDATSWVGLSSGGRLYAGASLRRLSHLDSYLAFLRDEMGMQDLVFGIRSGPPDVRKPRMKITEMDRRILRSMQHDSRKSSSAVAIEIEEERSAVEERISLMAQEKVVEFSAVLSPEACSDVLCMFHIFRKGRARLRDFMRDKLNQHSPNILFFNVYRNLPDLVMAMAWPADMAELREIKASLEEGEGVERVEANVILASRAVEGWADALIEDPPSKIDWE